MPEKTLNLLIALWGLEFRSEAEVVDPGCGADCPGGDGVVGAQPVGLDLICLCQRVEGSYMDFGDDGDD